MKVSASLELLHVPIWEKWELSVGWTGEKEQRARTSSDVLTFKVQEEKAQWPVAWEETQEQREELHERGNISPSHRPLGGPSERQGERSRTAPSKPLSPQGWGRADF